MTVRFGTIEEAREAARSTDTDPGVIKAIMDGDVEIGEPDPDPDPEQANKEESSEPVQEVSEQAQEQPLETDASVENEVPVEEDEEVKDTRTPEEIAHELYESAVSEINKQHQSEMETLKEEIEKLKSTPAPQPENKPEPKPELEIKVDDEDSDLASSYEKQTRQLLKSLAERQGIDPETKALLEENKKAMDTILSDKQKELARIKHEREIASVCSEVDEFSSSIPDLKLPVSARTALQQSVKLKGEIAKTLGITDKGKIEGAYRRIVRDDSDTGKRLRGQLEKVGVKIPDYMDKYLKIVELDDARSGLKFNMVTDSFEERERTLKEIFLAEHYPDLVKRDVTKQVESITNKLQGRQDSATTVLDVEVVETQQQASNEMTPQEASELIKGTSLSDLEGNKVLAQRYAEAFKMAGVQLPDRVKQFL